MPRKPLTPEQQAQMDHFIDRYQPQLIPQPLDTLGTPRTDPDLLLAQLCALHLDILNLHQLQAQPWLDALNHFDPQHVLARLARKHRTLVEHTCAAFLPFQAC